MASRDIRHMATPVDKRDAIWWLEEHSLAELAVTMAAEMVDSARAVRMLRFHERLLDVRMDHLEVVDDMCDAILARLSKVDRDAAEVAAKHYLHGVPWARCIPGKSYAQAQGAVLKAVRESESSL